MKWHWYAWNCRDIGDVTLINMAQANRKKIVLAIMLAPLIIFTLAVLFLGGQDDHRTNLRYLKWKYGRAPQDYKWCIHLMMVDSSWREAMQGRTMDQLRNWFPDAGPAKPNSWQGNWLASEPEDKSLSYAVIGDSQIAIRFRDGEFVECIPMKG